MNNRNLLVALGLLVALAVAATAVVLLRHSAAKPAAPAVAVLPTRPAVQPRKLPRKHVAPPAAVAPAESDLPVVAATPSLDPLADATADPAAFVASLSEKEFRDLLDVLIHKNAVKQRLKDRYKTNADLRLSFLNNAMLQKGELKITPAQQAQIDKIKDFYKPQMDALLADVWAKQEDTATLLEAGRRGLKTAEDYATFNQENQALLQQEKDLLQKAEEVGRPVTSQYADAVRAILTPDQQQQFDNIQVERLAGGGLKMSLKPKDANGQNQGGYTIITK